MPWWSLYDHATAGPLICAALGVAHAQHDNLGNVGAQDGRAGQAGVAAGVLGDDSDGAPRQRRQLWTAPVVRPDNDSEVRLPGHLVVGDANLWCPLREPASRWPRRALR